MINRKHFSQILAIVAISQAPFFCYSFTSNSAGPLTLNYRTAPLVPLPLPSPIAAATTKHAVLRKPLISLYSKNYDEESTSIETLAEDQRKTTNAVKMQQDSDKNPFQEYLSSIIPAHKNLVVSFMTLMIVLGTMMFNPLRANAVPSGGRVGGSFGGSSRSSSAPSTRMYSSPSNTYSRGFSRGYTSGYYSRPNVVITPPSPFFAPRPFFSPFWSPSYYGGPGVTVVSRGPNLFSFFALGGMLLFSSFVWNSMSSGLSSIGESSSFGTSTMAATGSPLGDGVSVVKLSVAMSVPNRDDPNSILSVIDRLSRTAKTDSRMGVSNLMSQVSLELLRRKDSIVAASSSYKKERDPTKAQREFNSLSVNERSKFEKETISRYGGVDYSSKPSSSTSDTSKATMAVVTLLLTIDGDSTQVPKIRSVNDVTSALSRIASDVKVGECLRSAEILWTPEERSDILSTRDILADYPDLTTI